ncbi:hypothetical protein O9K51_02003 [Purpureocillium lavendulum]|uniref:Short-chain dehydrogenase/reductase 3 n=1 Tax=Purpureocillium lavendulum TaxID=1247861 RepID=A0AB34G877_9HYPO|nr:hypothetical protein O9K51_02003 [Purpureocillium lavendulum]
MAEASFPVTFSAFARSLRAHTAHLIETIGSKIHEGPLLTLTSSDGWRVRVLQALCAAGTIYICNKAARRILQIQSAQKWNWKQEIVLITGGCSGIGEHMVRKFARRGVTVVVLDIAAPRTALPANAHFYQCDVTSPEAIRSCALRIRQDVGHPSILINNAGVGTAKTLLEETDEEIQRTFNVNSVSHFWIVREFLPHMIQQNHGHVVTIASMASFVTIASNVDYSCTKAAVLSFHEGLKQELRHRYDARNIETSIVHPSWVRTPLIEPLVKSGRWKEHTIEVDFVAEAIVAHILKGGAGKSSCQQAMPLHPSSGASQAGSKIA